MSDEERLREKVAQLARRLQGLYIQSRVARCVTMAAMLCIVFMLLHKARPVYPVFGDFFDHSWLGAIGEDLQARLFGIFRMLQ